MDNSLFSIFQHELDDTRFAFTADFVDDSFDHEFGCKAVRSWQLCELVRMEIYSTDLAEWLRVDITLLDAKVVKLINKLLQEHIDEWETK